MGVVRGATNLGTIESDWTIAGSGDFNADGTADILWRHSDGTVAIWLIDGTSLLSAGIPGSAPDRQIARVGDFDGDRKADILFRLTNGDVAVWFMDGTSIAGSGVLGNVDSSWVIQ